MGFQCCPDIQGTDIIGADEQPICRRMAFEFSCQPITKEFSVTDLKYHTRTRWCAFQDQGLSQRNPGGGQGNKFNGHYFFLDQTYKFLFPLSVHYCRGDEPGLN